jgi:hypothetical protein
MSQPAEDMLQPIIASLGVARGDIQKALGIVDRLRSLIDSPSIPKVAVRSSLVDLRAVVEGSKWTALGVLMMLATSDFIKDNLAFKQSLQEGSSEILKLFDNFGAKVIATTLILDSPDTQNETKIRQAIVDTCWPIINLGVVYEKLCGVLKIDPVGGLGWIARLIEEKDLGLNERWAAANCYLAAMEIAINKTLTKLEQDEDPNEEFSKKYNRLLKTLTAKGSPLTGLSKQLPHAFWRLRNEVTHAGYAPSREELELIIRWVAEMVQSLRK